VRSSGFEEVNGRVGRSIYRPVGRRPIGRGTVGHTPDFGPDCRASAAACPLHLHLRMRPETSRELAHDRAFADWVEAEALVAGYRRSVAAAVGLAAERARAAAMLFRAGRRDPFAQGVADAAQLLAQRVAAEERRLETALRNESRLRARVISARARCG
jgi:hypothetical protein